MAGSDAIPERFTRKARVTVTRTFGTPCPVGYHDGEAVSVELQAPGRSFRCPGVQQALEPFLMVSQESDAPEPLRFYASCHCPISKSEVVFHLSVSPPIHVAAAATPRE
ncbi:MAG TPA: hypothetical protein VFC51_08555 [Chloroflexota bacterium]|nr:hypothetical protein [Chloroflexota bacterium]